jgi:hypothetical protein
MKRTSLRVVLPSLTPTKQEYAEACRWQDARERRDSKALFDGLGLTQYLYAPDQFDIDSRALEDDTPEQAGGDRDVMARGGDKYRQKHPLYLATVARASAAEAEVTKQLRAYFDLGLGT